VKNASDKAKILTSTKQGDGGETRLFSGEKVPKSHLRLEVGGNLDECNAALGLAKALTATDQIRTIISTIQKHLVILGAEISSTEAGRHGMQIGEEHIAELEKWIVDLQKESPLPRHFVDPGANPASAALDLARAIIRRAERSMVILQEAERLDRTEPMSYLNRLSFLAFTLARYAETSDK
jgi:cob(I)alamin adenosyltransferase